MLSLDLSPILILILAIAGNFFVPLFPCPIRNMISNSMKARHISAFMTILFMITLNSYQKTRETRLSEIVRSTMWVYGLFIMLTRVHHHFFILLVGLFMVSYLFEVYYEANLPEPFHNKIDPAKFRWILNSVIVGLTMLGMLIYMGDKRIKHQENFSIQKFFLGVSECQGGPSSNLSYLDSLRGLWA
jgi:hypothetical protein